MNNVYRALKLMLLFLLIVILAEREVFAASLKYQNIYQYDANGRLIHMETYTGQIYYEYDANGNLLKKRIIPYPGLGGLDTPSKSKVFTTSLSVTGWHLDKTGVESISVYLNNQYKGLATYGDRRDDVYNHYPDFNNPNSGFHFNLDLPSPDTSYELRIIVRNKLGAEVTYTRSFQHVTLNPIGSIESPIEGQKITYYTKYASSNDVNKMTISGWYLDISQSKKYEIYINDVLTTPLSSYTSQSRADIYAQYPDYSNQSAGYNFTITKPSGFGGGAISLKIVVENTNGVRTVYSRSFVVQRSAAIVVSDPTNPGGGT